MNSTPSIGSLGITIDEVNDRVKVLHPNVFSTISDIQSRLKEDIAGNREARNLLVSSGARFSARVFGRGISRIQAFYLTAGLKVEEEARIHTLAGFDILYIGGNKEARIDIEQVRAERELAAESAGFHPRVGFPQDVFFERLTDPSALDVRQLLEMYRLCFTSYLVPLDEMLVRNAAANSIFFVARDTEGRIIASSIGESLRVGPITFLEVSEEAAHPHLRVRGAASGCAKRVIEEGKRILEPPVVAFWEARMWRNILGMGQSVGLSEFGGILHQHCRIASPPEFTSLPNPGQFGSLAVFYAP